MSQTMEMLRTPESRSVPARNDGNWNDRVCDDTGSPAFPGVIGTSPELRQAMEKAARLAASRVPVLLQGETGVGKEVFAKAIHAGSQASGGPFVALNCGGLSRELLASELFGYVDGAFTGARRGGMAGKIEAANGGTLFLDELGEMPLDLQPHLLRVLEDGCIYRLGDTTPRRVRFRLVAATHRDLRQDVAEGRFRMDLFYRVCVTSVHIPALRERRGDLYELARAFTRQLCRHHAVPEKVFDPRALERLAAYDWPGNVRELRNIVESLVLTVPGEVIGPVDLPAEILTTATTDEAPGNAITTALSGLAKGEFDQICRVLRETSGNATLAAKRLGIAKSTLYLKFKKYALDESLEYWRSA
jgi:transcriptional regulator with PAS, ATPase and Fis domain